MDLLYPLHPRFVHFPIALSLAGVAFIGLSCFLSAQAERWFWAGRLLVFLGWIGALLAGVSGVIDQSRAPDLPLVQNTISTHITAGIALIVVLGLVLYWPLKNKQILIGSQRWAYLALLLLGVVLVFVEGWLGGQLVYKLGVGVR